MVRTTSRPSTALKSQNNTRVLALLVTAVALVVSLAVPATASAAPKTVVVRHGPFTVDPYQVRFTARQNRAVESPGISGYITRMYARVVDERGRPIPVRRIMLHHVLYKNVGRFRGDRRDEICGHSGESFYGTGEENQPLRLPRGYGYRIHRNDRWHISWMLMNHRSVPDKAYIEYRAVVDTNPRLRHVTPYWLRVTGCDFSRDPIYNVEGGRPKGSNDVRREQFRLRRAGRLIAANAHIHGGSKGLVLGKVGCGRRPLMASRPLYGDRSHPYYNVLPVLHEPGPIASSWALSRRGIPIGKGEPLYLESIYDAHLPHPRVMGIMHLYVDHAARARQTCASRPDDVTSVMTRRSGRRDPPAVTVPLTGLDANGKAITIRRPPGRTRTFFNRPVVDMTNGTYAPRNISVAMGATVRWRAFEPDWHNVTLANGPEGFGSPMLTRGRAFTRRFTKPGVYRAYCTLHPIDMTGTIRVRRKRSRRVDPPPPPPPEQKPPPGLQPPNLLPIPFLPPP